jgi:Putative MetA-pathway of phenol degradation
VQSNHLPSSRKSPRRALLVLAAVLLSTPAAAAEQAGRCPTPADEIATDRPDVTNSSIVVPVGSVQNENGINVTGRDGGRTLDGTNSRLRLGIAPCLEVLVDLPTYFANVRQPGSSGFSDIAPAVKWQISPAPGKFDLSVTMGAALPIGAANIAGRGVQPYIQFPWSLELHDGWGLSGMFTEFFRPADATRRITETTFVVERKLTPNFALFTEYVGDYPEGDTPSVMLNSGGIYHLTRTQQLDFHVAVGLNHKAPSYIVGVGYSFRVDELFR